MSDTYDTYEDLDETAKSRPIALVGMMVMVLTGAAIIGNALFMQPKSAELEMMTRSEHSVDKSTTAAIPRSRPKTSADPANNPIASDRQAMVLAVQSQLTMAGFYVGPLDGKEGEQTREAVRAYEDAYGLRPTGHVTLALHDMITNKISLQDYVAKQGASQIAANDQTKPDALGAISSAMPAMLNKLPRSKPRFKPKRIAQTPKAQRPKVVAPKPVAPQRLAVGPIPPKPIPLAASSSMLAKVQAGLNRLGYGKVTADGKMGSITRAAITDFQRRRGHPITGEINDRLLKEMMLMGYLELG